MALFTEKRAFCGCSMSSSFEDSTMHRIRTACNIRARPALLPSASDPYPDPHLSSSCLVFVTIGESNPEGRYEGPEAEGRAQRGLRLGAGETSSRFVVKDNNVAIAYRLLSFISALCLRKLGSRHGAPRLLACLCSARVYAGLVAFPRLNSPSYRCCCCAAAAATNVVALAGWPPYFASYTRERWAWYGKTGTATCRASPGTERGRTRSPWATLTTLRCRMLAEG